MHKQTLTILIPAYNEAARIDASLDRIEAFILSHTNFDISIVVVNDGSKDDTEAILQAHHEITLHSYTKNKGKGYALRYGMERIQTNYVYICDADLAVSIDQLADFLALHTEADCIIGSKTIVGAEAKTSWHRKVLSNIGNRCITSLLGLSYSDTQCGFKLLNRKAQTIFRSHQTNRWGFDFDFLMRAKKAGLCVREIPVSCEAAVGSTVRLSAYITTLRELLLVWWRLRIKR